MGGWTRGWGTTKLQELVTPAPIAGPILPDPAPRRDELAHGVETPKVDL